MKNRRWGGQTRASVPTFGTTFNRINYSFTRQLINSSTLPNHNFELEEVPSLIEMNASL
ncbi:DNA-directed RNA polymerase II [Prevotella veroralis]|uniref:DNA-directed RNA polymerase II n=1 Tax=Prevotella veroralis TaxID=28137 RepID=UPI001F3E8AA7|nr:DNA-directed RNA polymerase II [Prevotella veroralis]